MWVKVSGSILHWYLPFFMSEIIFNDIACADGGKNKSDESVTSDYIISVRVNMCCL